MILYLLYKLGVDRRKPYDRRWEVWHLSNAFTVMCFDRRRNYRNSVKQRRHQNFSCGGRRSSDNRKGVMYE